MWLKPPPGRVYRDTVTRQLWPEEGREHDPANLDEVRALAVGDLVESDTAAAEIPARKRDKDAAGQ